MDQELPLQGLKWLVPMESNVLLSEMGRAQFPVTRSPQKTLAGLVFALAVVGVAPGLTSGRPRSLHDRWSS
jgi:hypothetical protein